MTTTTVPRALREYRALDTEARRAYDPSGKPGADAVRHLQTISGVVARLRDARHQARTNPKYPAWRLADAIGAARNLRAGLAYHLPTPEPMPRDAARHYYTLPLGAQDAEIAAVAAHAAHSRRRNWIEIEPSLAPVCEGACREYTIEYRGRHKGRLGANWAPTMRAMARVSLDGAILTALIGHSDGGHRPEAVYTVQAGRGYQWQADVNGVRLVRLADGADYHPTTDEVRAGRAGTENFARRHNLDTRRHYRADALPKPSNSDESRRVALAVLTAKRRQARELVAGFCAI